MTQSDPRDDPETTMEPRHANPGGAALPVEPGMETIERAKRGDLRAFEELYRKSAGRVNALCLRMAGGDQARAQDFVQEVYLRVWERLATFEGRAQFSSWIHRVAVNRVTDLMRMEIGRSLLQFDTGENPAAPRSPAPRPDLVIDLENAMRSLPAGARAVFVLHDVEGYGHEEIAVMTGISAGTSKSQLHRARRLLRERLSR